jgi:hypothetical protein
MTIHWKAFERGALSGTISFSILRGKMHFLNFSKKTFVLKELKGH